MKMSKEDRAKATQTMVDLVKVLDEVEDLALKEKLCDNIILLCDQLKSTFIMDKVNKKL